MKAAGGIQRADRFLQNEVGAHAKGLLRGRSLSVKDGKGNGVLVAASAPQTLQHRQSTVQIVAVHDHRVELIGDKNVCPCLRFMADFHFNR